MVSISDIRSDNSASVAFSVRNANKNLMSTYTLLTVFGVTGWLSPLKNNFISSIIILGPNI